MQPGTLFITINKDVLLGLHRTAGQLPGLVGIVGDAQFVLVQVHCRGTCIVQFYPRVGELVDIIHHAVDVRLHDFVDDKLRMAWHDCAKHGCCEK